MAQLNPKEMQQALAKPFAPEDLEWRLQIAYEDRMQGIAVPYVTNRAIQNRLEHTISNLDTAAENTQTAESRIRDTDMAEEMVEYSKNNILAQAGQSMLAQANQSTQGVLSLLQ